MILNLPLHRLLGGYRYRIQTSITLSLAPIKETVELARNRAKQGFRILKLKGGLDPEEDVRRVQAVRATLPDLILRLAGQIREHNAALAEGLTELAQSYQYRRILTWIEQAGG